MVSGRVVMVSGRSAAAVDTNASKSSTLRLISGFRQVAVVRNKVWVPKWDSLGSLREIDREDCASSEVELKKETHDQ
jgi:hypothetical protein